MSEEKPVPSLVGFRPEEAEEAARTLETSVIWVDAPPPRWLSAQHEPRVGRQHVRPDGVIELLRVLVPQVADAEKAE